MKLKIIIAVYLLQVTMFGQNNTKNYNVDNLFNNTKKNVAGNPDSIKSKKLNSNFRNGYFYLTIGVADILGIGFGYQINKNYAIGLKWGTYWISGKGSNHGGGFAINSGTGFGLKISRKLSFWVFNNLNGAIMLYYRTSEIMSLTPIIKGAAFDINVGHENTIENGFNFIWSLGFVASTAKGVVPLFIPNLKVGFNINF